MRVTVTALNEIDRAARYGTFTETGNDSSRLATGIRENTNRITLLQRQFANWYRDRKSVV